MKIKRQNPSWWIRNHTGCRTMRHMHDRWPQCITRHAGTGRKITEIPQQGPDERWICVCGCRCVSGEWQWRHAGNVWWWPCQACLEVVELCAGKIWCGCRLRAERQTDFRDTDEERRLMMTHTNIDGLGRALAGRRQAEAEKGWMMDGWMEGENFEDWMKKMVIHGLDIKWKTGAVNAYERLWMGMFIVTCVWGRGRPRAEGLVAGRPTLLLSSSSARVSCSNCTSCSLTDSSRAAALSHCSIHTTRPQGERGGALHTSTQPRTHYSTGRAQTHLYIQRCRIFSGWY